MAPARLTVQLPYMTRATARTTRIALRAEKWRAERIRFAAKLSRQSVASFMLDAASARAEDVISARTATEVPPHFFDELFAALSESARPNAALSRRAWTKRRITQR